MHWRTERLLFCLPQRGSTIGSTMSEALTSLSLACRSVSEQCIVIFPMLSQGWHNYTDDGNMYGKQGEINNSGAVSFTVNCKANGDVRKQVPFPKTHRQKKIC